MYPANLSFVRLKQLVSIPSVLARQGRSVILKKCGNQLVGPCPVHGGDNPNAFVVSLSKNLWHCFTMCDGGGDVIELVRRLHHMTYRETAEYLASLATMAPVTLQACSAIRAIKPFRPFTIRLPLDAFTPWLKKKAFIRTLPKPLILELTMVRGF